MKIPKWKPEQTFWAQKMTQAENLFIKPTFVVLLVRHGQLQILDQPQAWVCETVRPGKSVSTFIFINELISIHDRKYLERTLWSGPLSLKKLSLEVKDLTSGIIRTVCSFSISQIRTTYWCDPPRCLPTTCPAEAAAAPVRTWPISPEPPPPPPWLKMQVKLNKTLNRLHYFRIAAEECHKIQACRKRNQKINFKTWSNNDNQKHPYCG